MVKGLPRAIIKKYGVTKKAWAVYRGRHHSRVSKTKKNGGGKTRMVKHRRFSRRGHSTKSIIRTAEKLAGAGTFLYPGINRMHEKYGSEPIWAVAADGLALYGGIRDAKFSFGTLVEAWGPFISFQVAKTAAHKIAGLIRRV
jgi:hypothetical protein